MLDLRPLLELFALEPELFEREVDFAFGLAFEVGFVGLVDFEVDFDLDALPSVAASSPRTALRLSSSAAIRSGALVGFGSSLGALTTSLPAAFRSSRSSSSSRYSSR